MQTKVIISVDVEASIAGALTASKYKPLWYEPIYGLENEGLAFMTKALGEKGFKGTFFLETISDCYFKDGEIASVAEFILNEVQDLQLHVHPCWRYFATGERVSDHFSKLDFSQSLDIINHGLSFFDKYKLARPVAMRTGNLSCSIDTYKAMKASGLLLGSNIGLGVYNANFNESKYSSGAHIIEGVTEFPVLTYDQNLPKLSNRRCLQITSCSFQEIKSLLRSANQLGYDYVVLLTHPFEFLKYDDALYTNVRPNDLTKWRFEKLLDFVKESEQFDIVPFADLAVEPKDSVYPPIKGKRHHSILRYGSQIAGIKI